MTEAEAIYGGWIAVYGGFFVFALVALQMWLGKAPMRGRIVRRKTEPGTYWYALICEALFGVFCVVIGLARVTGIWHV